jgi:hypothetical protein
MHTANDKGGISLSSFDDTDKLSKDGITNVKSLTGDSDSEEAILFERSMQVMYEEASLNGSSGSPLHQPKIWSK